MEAAIPAVGAQSASDKEVARARQQVDRILYLASLASRREDIDGMMDTLREVTASWNQSQPLSPEKASALDGLEAKLKSYLINEDPLRAFTQESLERRIQTYASGGRLGSATRSLLAVALISIASTGIGFILPLDLTLQTRALLAIPLLFTSLHLGIVWFYLTSLRNFKAEVRRVFLFFCAAAIIFAIGFSQFVVLEFFDLTTRYVALRYCGIAALFGIPFALMYLGLRLYAKLLGIKSRLLSLKYSLIIAAVIMTAPTLLPHTKAANELFFDLSTMSAMMIPAFGLMGAFLANRIRKQVTAAYAKPMTAIYWYMGLNGLTGPLAVVALFWAGELRGTVLSVVLAVCGIPPQAILLFAGYLFKRETGR